MGHGTDPDPTGNDCLCCWEAGETPSKVLISYMGIDPCEKPFNGNPQPRNEIKVLLQDENFPCNFELSEDNWLFIYQPCHNGTSIASQTWNGDGYFLHQILNNCEIMFENVLNCAGPTIFGHNGIAGVMWNFGPADHSIGSLLNSINMEPHPETKFEIWAASEQRMCVRFARKKDATNMLILVEPTEL